MDAKRGDGEKVAVIARQPEEIASTDQSAFSWHPAACLWRFLLLAVVQVRKNCTAVPVVLRFVPGTHKKTWSLRHYANATTSGRQDSTKAERKRPAREESAERLYESAVSRKLLRWKENSRGGNQNDRGLVDFCKRANHLMLPHIDGQFQETEAYQT
ncbi:hypothetical protein BKA80DRAFT_59521 [Phyllosticta citrichinensis]